MINPAIEMNLGPLPGLCMAPSGNVPINRLSDARGSIPLGGPKLLEEGDK